MAIIPALEFAAKTDTGLLRTQNEDAVSTSQAHGFAVLADGMGGYNAGEVASSIAVLITRQVLEEGPDSLSTQTSDKASSYPKQLQQLLTDAFQRANNAILQEAQLKPEQSGMGTTLVAAVFHRDKVTVAHVGDSRAYRFRRNELIQITRDHSLIQEQIDAGLLDPELARFSRNRNLITRAVGVGPEMEVEVHEHQAEPGDIFLLCSDGLSDMLLDDEICELLNENPSSLEAACEALVQKANDNGGHDNVSVILVRVHTTASEGGNLLGRILSWIK